MEIRKVKIKGVEYTILDKYYRTPGSFNQRLVLEKDSKNIVLEEKCYFYLLLLNKKKYWAKVNISLTEATREFERGSKYNSIKIESSNFTISNVFHIVRDANVILLEYLEDYTNYVNLDSSYTNDKPIIKNAIKEWFKKSNIDFYDLSVNNILVKKQDQKLDIRLIDFAEAPDKNNSWCLNNIDIIL